MGRKNTPSLLEVDFFHLLVGVVERELLRGNELVLISEQIAFNLGCFYK